MLSRAKILYLSYDGLSDPLGQSQVLPYLLGLAETYEITLVTFEKPKYFKQNKDFINVQIDGKLNWIPKQYTKNPPVLSTVFDLLILRKIVKKLIVNQSFDIVHCRSYLTSIIGLWLKRKFKIPFIFDMRGFWADERVEGGIWNIKNPIYRYIYQHFKKLEIEFLDNSDQIISLTKKAVKPLILIGDGAFNEDKIEIIPCCVDIGLFNNNEQNQLNRNELKNELGFSSRDKILIYTGSMGTWYMIDEMLDFYHQLHQTYPLYKLLIITRDGNNEILTRSTKKGIDSKNIIVKSANRQEVVVYLSLSDLSYYFIRPTFSKIASSPTKLPEYMSMGIPIITNTNVGDIENVALTIGKGIILIENFNKEAYANAIEKIALIPRTSGTEIRSFSKSYFSLRLGIQKYNKVYKKILQ